MCDINKNDSISFYEDSGYLRYWQTRNGVTKEITLFIARILICIRKVAKKLQ